MSNLKKMPGTLRSPISVACEVAAYWLVKIVLDEVEPGGEFCADDGFDWRRVNRERGKKENGEKKDEEVVDGDEGEGEGVRV